MTHDLYRTNPCWLSLRVRRLAWKDLFDNVPFRLILSQINQIGCRLGTYSHITGFLSQWHSIVKTEAPYRAAPSPLLFIITFLYFLPILQPFLALIMSRMHYEPYGGGFSMRTDTGSSGDN